MIAEPRRQPSCDDPVLRDALPLEEARRRILAQIAPLAECERLPIEHALGRVLAEPVKALRDVPPHANSAVDGYALRGEDLPESGGRELRIVGTALAGRPLERAIGPGEAVRIMTGAPIPPGADTVLMQEHCEAGADWVRVGPGHRVGENLRRAGEDLRRGEEVLAAGRRLRPADLGLAASQGVSELEVLRSPRVAVFSTGDELCPQGVEPGPGQIYDSNRFTLMGMLQRLGAEVIDLGSLPDDPEVMLEALERAGREADVVLTSGGVSVGEADYVKTALTTLGSVDFWKVAIKPGRPLAFGRLGDALFFGLPGNPVAVMVTFYQLVRPALLRLAGEQAPDPLLVPAVTESRLRKRPGRTEFQRGLYRREADGRLTVRPWGPDGSGILRSMSAANCFIVLPHEAGSVEAGEQVDIQPFEALE